MVIIDFGAGTVDVSVLEINKSIEGLNSKLLAVKRSGFIGGNLLDKMILEKIVVKNSILLEEDKYNELLGYCEKLKIKLCGYVKVDKTVNYRLPPNGDSLDNVFITTNREFNVNGLNSINLSFHEFKILIDNYWDVILETIEPAIRESVVNINQIDKVILTGGGGRNPYIKNKVATYFQTSGLVIPDNIQEHVARGAALHSFVFNSYGKNIITPILGQSIFITGANKTITLFESGEPIPSIDREIYLDDDLQEYKIIHSRYGEDNQNEKWFIIQKEISVLKLLFYINNDQEIECEVLTTKSIIKAEHSRKKPNFKLINLK
jgi:hypothetical protein